MSLGSESYDYIEVRLSNISGAGIVGANIDMGTLLADAASADWTVTTLANEIVLGARRSRRKHDGDQRGWCSGS